MASGMTPQEVFESLAVSTHVLSVKSEVDAIVELLEQSNHPGWFWWLFLHWERGGRPC